ncbi:serine/threonine-protein kinase ht1 [Phtheirospermum japonicum]|uniref:Serine/threonine-protein kinase ht1 n=1 Tax=Phtheirospermum japonicum TaxID=374723 RepID=A0A830BXV5_9LAMI|nr:serine/threonine-protein kinase ht1 [Phtheirospermum japonicum]
MEVDRRLLGELESMGFYEALATKALFSSGQTLRVPFVNNPYKFSLKGYEYSVEEQFVKGLSYIHSKKIVLRDVKTENMLLQTDKTLKIADFGVAQIEAQNLRDMTGNTGTLGYMAPEVLDGKPYNRKCDVYSFGNNETFHVPLPQYYFYLKTDIFCKKIQKYHLYPYSRAVDIWYVGCIFAEMVVDKYVPFGGTADTAVMTCLVSQMRKTDQEWQQLSNYTEWRSSGVFGVVLGMEDVSVCSGIGITCGFWRFVRIVLSKLELRIWIHLSLEKIVEDPVIEMDFTSANLERMMCYSNSMKSRLRAQCCSRVESRRILCPQNEFAPIVPFGFDKSFPKIKRLRLWFYSTVKTRAPANWLNMNSSRIMFTNPPVCSVVLTKEGSRSQATYPYSLLSLKD